jgi:hypothetical protein
MTSNLNKLYRVPKININLPTGGKYYPENQVKFSMDGSLPIRAMTAKDELMLKSPDSLLNGDCLVHIIQSCVPEITNVRKLLAPDVEAILLGIFHASYGPTMEIKASCPVCNHKNDFELTIREILDDAETFECPASVTIDLGVQDNIPTKFVVWVNPYTFETSTKQQLMLFEHSKLLQVMASDTASDEDKVKVFNDSFKKMVEIKFQSVLDSVLEIEINREINGEIQIEKVDSKEDIKEFIFNADKDLVDPIIAKIDELNKIGIRKTFDAVCSGTITEESQDTVTYNEETGEQTTVHKEEVKRTCGHKWPANVEFNPASFFDKGLSRSARLK